MAERRRPCGKCGKKRAERFFKTKRSRVCQPCQKARAARTAKDRRLRENYGISIEDYDRLYAAQKGCCAICGGYRRVLEVDHDHAAEREGLPVRMTVRGLICRRDNKRLLPACRDRIDVLQRAITYLQRPPARRYLLSGPS